jgi:hypothetical protein
VSDETTYADEQISILSNETGCVRIWRFEELRRLGFATAAAMQLVDAPVELSAARRLIGLGCPHTLAAAILL